MLEENFEFQNEINRLDIKSRQQQLDDEQKALENAKKNHDFVQFTRKGLLKLSRINNLLSHQIFLFISKEMDRENKVILSQQTLAEIFDVSRQSINTAIKELEKNEMLSIYKVGSTNVYCLNANIVWTTYRDKIELAKFKANVIISKSEQEKIKKIKSQNLKQVTLKD
jgi:DNA-binding transcriptional regulator YhcF (GntR family)